MNLRAVTPELITTERGQVTPASVESVTTTSSLIVVPEFTVF